MKTAKTGKSIRGILIALLLVSAGAHAQQETDKVNGVTIKRGYPLPQDVETLTGIYPFNPLRFRCAWGCVP